MNSLPDLYTIGFFVSIFGVLITVTNIFSNAAGGDTKLKYGDFEINGARSTIIFLVGLALMAFHAYRTTPVDAPIDLPKEISPPSMPTSSVPSPESLAPSHPSNSSDKSYNKDNDNQDENFSPGSTFENNKVLGWSYFGQMSNGTWDGRKFRGGSGPSGAPKNGDHLVALTDVSLRTGPIQLTISGWKNQTRIGVIKNGDSVIVKEVDVIDRGYYWISIKENVE